MALVGVGIGLVVVGRGASAVRELFVCRPEPAHDVERCVVRGVLWLWVVEMLTDGFGAALTPLVILAPLGALKSVVLALVRGNKTRVAALLVSVAVGGMVTAGWWGMGCRLERADKPSLARVDCAAVALVIAAMVAWIQWAGRGMRRSARDTPVVPLLATACYTLIRALGHSPPFHPRGWAYLLSLAVAWGLRIAAILHECTAPRNPVIAAANAFIQGLGLSVVGALVFDEWNGIRNPTLVIIIAGWIGFGLAVGVLGVMSYEAAPAAPPGTASRSCPATQ